MTGTSTALEHSVNLRLVPWMTCGDSVNLRLVPLMTCGDSVSLRLVPWMTCDGASQLSDSHTI